MSAEGDRFGERLANVEGTVEQMDKRVDDLGTRMNERFDALDNDIGDVDRKIDREIQNLRTDIRRWLLVLFAGMSLVVAVVSVAVQLLL